MSIPNVGGTKIPGLNYPVLNAGSEIYINIDFLEEYQVIVIVDSAFDAIDGAVKEAAIFRSQIYIESKYYQGSKFWEHQILQWPRYPVYDKSGLLVDTQQTPYDIFNAVAEGAYWESKEPGILLPQETTDDVYPINASRVKAGSVESEKGYDTANKQTVSRAARLTRLQAYLKQWVLSQGVSVPLMRT